jgi:hypothetical protein
MTLLYKIVGANMRIEGNENYQQKIIKILVDEFLIKTDKSADRVIDTFNSLQNLEPIKEDIARSTILKHYIEKFFKLESRQLPLWIVFDNDTFSPSGYDKSLMYYPIEECEEENNKEVSVLILTIILLLIDSPVIFIATNAKSEYIQIQPSIKAKAKKGEINNKKISEAYKEMLGRKINIDLLSQISQDLTNGYSINEQVNRCCFVKFDSKNILYTHRDDNNSYQSGTTITMNIALNLGTGL